MTSSALEDQWKKNQGGKWSEGWSVGCLVEPMLEENLECNIMIITPGNVIEGSVAEVENLIYILYSSIPHLIYYLVCFLSLSRL